MVVESFFLGLASIFSLTAANSLFVVNVGAAALPYVYTAVAVCVPLIGLLYLRLEKRLGQRQLLTGNLAVVTLAFCCLRFLLHWSHSPIVEFAVLVFNDVAYVLISLAFWGAAGHLLDLRQAKRLFGLIGSGEVAASVLGGLTVPYLVARIGTENLLIVAAAAMVVAVFTQSVVLQTAALRAIGPSDRSARRLNRRPQGRYPYLVFALVACSMVVYYVIDKSFYDVVQQHFPRSEDLAAFLGIFFAAADLLKLIARAGVTGPILTRFGATGGLMFLPCCVGICVAATVVMGMTADLPMLIFWSVCASKFVFRTVRHSIDRPSVLLLYQPLPAFQRTATQTIAEGICGPLAAGLTGLTLIGLSSLMSTTAALFASLALVVVVAWTIVIRALRVEYMRILTHIVARRELSAERIVVLDRSSLEVLKQGLENKHPQAAIYALRMLEETQRDALDDGLPRLLQHPAAEVRIEALEVIERSCSAHLKSLVRNLVDGGDTPKIRGIALRVYGSLLRPEEAARELWPYLETAVNELADPAAANRLAPLTSTGQIPQKPPAAQRELLAGALVGLLRTGAENIESEAVAKAVFELRRLSESPSAQDRILAARIIGLARQVGSRPALSSHRSAAQPQFTTKPDPPPIRSLIALLRDADPEVRRVAFESAALVNSDSVWPHVIAGLSTSKTRASAVTSLVSAGESIVPLLEEAFGRPERSWRTTVSNARRVPNKPPTAVRPQRQRIIRILGRIRGPRAVAALLKMLDDADPEITRSALSALAACRYQVDRAWRNRMRSMLRGEARSAARVLVALADVEAEERSTLLVSALRWELSLHHQCLFCLLSFLYPAPFILRAREYFRNGTQQQKAIALELVEQVISRADRELVFALFEDQPPQEVLRHIKPELAVPRMTRVERLRDLISPASHLSSPWTKACALDSISQETCGDQLVESIVEALSIGNSLVRETAIRALASVSPEALQSELQTLQTDQTPQVVAAVDRFCINLDQGAKMLLTVEKVMILKTVSIFAETPESVLAQIAANLEIVELPAGATLFKKGDLGTSMYIIIDGTVNIHDEEKVVRALESRSIFGELAALDPEPRSASVTAVQDARLFKLDQATLMELMSDQPEIVRGVLRVLCERIRWSSRHGMVV